MQKPPAKEGAGLYNVKILRNFVLYLRERENFTDEQLEQLFALCGSDLSSIEADDNWFDQAFSDRFYESVVKLTGDADIAYKVGSYTLTGFSKGLAGILIQGSLSAAYLFRNIHKITRHYTKGSYYEPIKVTRGRAIIRSIVESGCEEKPYQCRNRQGMLESVPSFFGSPRPASEHRICYHLGGPYCEYEFHWKEPFRFSPLPIAVGTGLSFAVASTLFTTLGSSLWLGASLGMLAFIIMRELLILDYKKTLAEQNTGLEESVKILERRRDEQVLLREIIKATTEMMPIDQLCRLTVELVQKSMQYDRAIILMVDSKTQILKTQASIGFGPQLSPLIDKAEFNIRKDNTSGFFIRVVNSAESILERDVQKNLAQQSPRSQELLRTLGTQAFIAVPILFKGEVFGVLSVENASRSKPLNTNDRDLLTSLADHLAVAVSNARSFEATKLALERTQQLEKKERDAKELFQKYVPTEVIDEQDTFVEERKLTFLVNKKLTVMFADIVGFTSMSERRPPGDVADIISVYVEVINEVVTMHHGRINKVIGDGLLIYFDPEKANAVEAGFAILQNLSVMNSRLASRNFPPISIALGVHQGVCTLGSIGYRKRLDYTLIGDTVNIASRIQTSSRQWGKDLLCFSSVLLEEAKNFESQSRGKIPLKGRVEAVEIYQLGGPRSVKIAS